MRKTSVAFLVLAAAGCASGPRASAGAPHSDPETLTYHSNGRKIGTLLPDGTIRHEPPERLTAKVDSNGNLVDLAGTCFVPGAQCRWTLSSDGVLALNVDATSAGGKRFAIFRGVRLNSDGTVQLLPPDGPTLSLREDGSLLRRTSSGSDVVDPTWRVEGNTRGAHRRAMVGLLVLDDLFGTNDVPPQR